MLWAHVSMVWVQLQAYFDLLDMIDFEYVINLSGADYPLKTPSVMSKALKRLPGYNWVWWSDDPQENTLRLEFLWHCRDQPGVVDGRCTYTDQVEGYRAFLLQDLFPVQYKSSQWMILTKQTVEYLRSSESLRLLLLWSEHSSTPDETFMTAVLASSPFRTRTLRDPKRLMKWNHEAHPHTWTAKDEELIRSNADAFFFIRKVDTDSDIELKWILDDVRSEGRIAEPLVHKYQPHIDGIVPVDKYEG